MFLPEHIDLAHSEKYVLSIRIQPDGFMFSIHEPGLGKSYCLRETTFSSEMPLLNNIQKIIFELNFLTQEFKQTNVIFVSQAYDIIPSLFYNEKERATLYNFSHSLKAETVLDCVSNQQDQVFIYNTETSIFEFLTRSLFNPVYYHHSFLLSQLFESKGSSQTSRMFLNFHDDFVDMLCYRGKKLEHCLTYYKESPSNLAYYALKLWEESEFNQLSDYIYLTGKQQKQVESILQDYIKNVEFVGPPGEIYLWNKDAEKAPIDLLFLAL